MTNTYLAFIDLVQTSRMSKFYVEYSLYPILRDAYWLGTHFKKERATFEIYGLKQTRDICAGVNHLIMSKMRNFEVKSVCF